MSKRIYNILFHTHTISGIIISAALYVIFFTGSISFLRDEISAWERNQPVEETYFNDINFDDLLNTLAKEQNLYGRDISFSNRFFERIVSGSMSKSKDTTIVDDNKRGRRGNFFGIDVVTHKKTDYMSHYGMGEFFYRLHFFAQLNFFGRSGYFLAGFVAFFFLFAVITGVVVHWNKIISSFYVFRPKEKWKTIWTDAHVALGMIGLPYQFMFAVTGCFLIIGYSVMLPPVKTFMFNDNQQEMGDAMRYEIPVEYTFSGEKLATVPSVNNYINETLNAWPDFYVNDVKIINYGDKGMHIKVGGTPGFDKEFLGESHRTYRVSDKAIVEEHKANQYTSFAEEANNVLRRLHFGDYGGYGMKIIYLVLGFVTCFVILSGVYIWLVARDRKNVPEYKRKFNFWLVNIYSAICLSLYPITAITFSAMKLFADAFGDERRSFLYQVFFWGWLALSVLFIIKRNNHFTNKACLWLGAIFGLFVPISNGLVTGNWLWVSIQKGYDQILVIDLFWLITSIISIAIALKIKPQTEKEPVKKN